MTSDRHQNLSGASIYEDLKSDQSRTSKIMQNVIFHVKL